MRALLLEWHTVIPAVSCSRAGQMHGDFLGCVVARIDIVGKSMPERAG